MPELERYIYGYHYMRDVVIPACKRANVLESDIHKMSVCLENFAVYKCAACGYLHIASHYRCKNRFCVCCQHQRTKIWLAKLVPMIKKWKDAGNYVCMLNFTMIDLECLDDMIYAINNAFRILSHDNKYNREWFNSRFPGGIRSLEVVIGENSGIWHAHLHCIVLQDKFERDYNELEFRWNRACQLSLGVEEGKVGSVYISAINGNNIEQSVLEVIKYILKPNIDLYTVPDKFKEAYECLKGRKQVNTWGIFRNLIYEVDKDFERDTKDFECEHCGSEFAAVEFLDLKECNLSDRGKEEDYF